MIWLEPKSKNKVLRNRYSGEFKDGQREGLGIFYYANGSTYEGQWKNNCKHGYAMYIDEDGKAIYGYFQRDKLVRTVEVYYTLLETLVKADLLKRKSDFLDSSRDSNLLNSRKSTAKPPLPTTNRQRSQAQVSIQEGAAQQSEDGVQPLTELPVDNTIFQSQAQEQQANSNNNRTENNNSNNNQPPQATTSQERLPTEEHRYLVVNTEQGSVPSQPSNRGNVRGLTRDEIMERTKRSKLSKLSMEKELEEFRAKNLYFDLIKLHDFISKDSYREYMKIKIKVCETLLRHNSHLKDCYKIYAASNSKDYEEGFFMSLSSFYKMLVETRLLNGRVNRVNLGRLMIGYGERDFELYYNQKSVLEKIDLVKRYDFASQNEYSAQATGENFGRKDSAKTNLTYAEKTQGEKFRMSKAEKMVLIEKNEIDDPNFSFEQKIKTLLLDRVEVKQKRLENCTDPDKVLLFRGFVNSLVRAVYLKTGSINTLSKRLEEYLSKRAEPIIYKKIRPKLILNEDASIIRKSEKILKTYEETLRKIYKEGYAAFSRTSFMRKERVLDVSQLATILHKCGQMKYDSFEEKRLFWMIVERHQDPEKSVFRLVRKIENRSGKTHESIESRIRAILGYKMQAELTYREFRELFIVLFCKMVSFWRVDLGRFLE